jgi:hypothetical protein
MKLGKPWIGGDGLLIGLVAASLTSGSGCSSPVGLHRSQAVEAGVRPQELHGWWQICTTAS